jgi:integrase
LEHDKYLKLRGGFPELYKTLFVCGYHLGCRSGELRKIEWPQVDFDRKEIVIQRSHRDLSMSFNFPWIRCMSERFRLSAYRWMFPHCSNRKLD